MANQRQGGIAWTDQTWNPIRGCRRVSPECTNCYAERVAARFSGRGQPYHGLATMTSNGPRWTGDGRFLPDVLLDPLRWQRPRLVFVNSMSDLFFDAFTDHEVDLVLAVMMLARRHTFQVLTKRQDRMLAYLSAPGLASRVAAVASGLLFDIETGRNGWSRLGPIERFGGRWISNRGDGSAAIQIPVHWPLENVWWGVSAGDEKYARERLPVVLQCRPFAKVIWASLEPLIGPIDVWPWVKRGEVETSQTSSVYYDGLDWIVVGGESGPDARPMNPAWARSIRDVCQGTGTRFHFKQWGEFAEAGTQTAPIVTTADMWDPGPNRKGIQARMVWPGGQVMQRIGKKAAGRVLDGKVWHEWPDGFTGPAPVEGKVTDVR